MPRFEAHMTFPKESADTIRQLGQALGWTYSQITGCPLLGPGTYCYLTGYDPDGQELLARLTTTAGAARALGVEPLRLKIEQIVYDTRTGVNELQS